MKEYTLNAKEAKALIRYFMSIYPNKEVTPSDMCIFAMLIKAWDLDPTNPCVSLDEKEEEK